VATRCVVPGLIQNITCFICIYGIAYERDTFKILSTDSDKITLLLSFSRVLLMLLTMSFLTQAARARTNFSKPTKISSRAQN